MSKKPTDEEIASAVSYINMQSDVDAFFGCLVILGAIVGVLWWLLS